MTIPSRSYSSNLYRYGFNGKEKDDELKGEGNSYDFGARMYDNRIGRWFARDPLERKYPYLSPYLYSGNNPILFTDFDGRDFGVKINHTTKTITIVANIYTVNNTGYGQAIKGAKQWNDLSGKHKVDGYTINFELKVHKPLDINTITDDEVISKYKNENFYNRKKEIKTRKLRKYKRKLLAIKAKESAQKLLNSDNIGNLYSGVNGEYSKTILTGVSSFVGGVTKNSKEISMNSHPDFDGDLGNKSDLVTHEIGHLLGLDDKGKGPYYDDSGVMKYGGLDLKPPSLGDVEKIIKYANDFINGRTRQGNVTVLEEKGENSDKKSPIRKDEKKKKDEK